MRILTLIRTHACLVNGTSLPAGYHLAPGDLVELLAGDEPPTAMDPEDLPLEIIFEDEAIVVLVKPAGMLVHPTRSVKTGTLANALAYHLNRFRNFDSGHSIGFAAGTSVEPEVQNVDVQNRGHETAELFRIEQATPADSQPFIRPGLVHRLDRATSGLMVVAKTQRALSVLTRHFHRRLVEKRYLAAVNGRLPHSSGSIIAPIGRDPQSRPQWGVMETGRQAETRYRLLDDLGRASLVELEPVTGRTNQLRIHCAYAGAPIIGDKMYGGVGPGISGEDSEGPHAADSAGPGSVELASAATSTPASRLCLHAVRLAFHHPSNGNWMEFDSPLPADLVAVIEGLKEGR